MQRLPVPLAHGLRFSQRNSSYERLLNLSLSGKREVLTTRRKHVLRCDIGVEPTALIYHEGYVYTLAVDGQLRVNPALPDQFVNPVIDTGFSTKGQFHITASGLNYTKPYLFVAATKMRKVDLDTNTPSNWGIAAPTAGLGVGSTFETIITLSNCDSTTGWAASGTGLSISSEATIKTQGTNSLKITVSAGADGWVTFTPGAPIDISTTTPTDFIYFSERMTKPGDLDSLVLQLNLANDGFASNVASFDMGLEGTGKGGTLEAQYTGAANAWKECHIQRSLFTYSESSTTLHALRFYIKSDTAMEIYIDDLRFLLTGPDAVNGSRWAYRYYNTTTKAASNLSPAFLSAIGTNRAGLVLTGFVASTDPQVDRQQVFRDTNSNGVFQYVGEKANDANNFSDTIPTVELGEVDTNDNATPQPATVIAFAFNRIWTNDTAVPDRVWRSKPGRYEAMSEFFTLGTSDPVTFIGTIGGQFCVTTTNHLFRVIGAETDSPVFSPITDIGGLTPTAATLRGATADLLHFTGLFNFNGSTLIQLPYINSLFEQNSTDLRRINALNIDRVVIGSNDIYLWLTYQRIDGIWMTFVFDSIYNEWFEENVNLVAHDTAHLTINHIAGDRSGKVYDIYADQSGYETAVHIPLLLDLMTLDTPLRRDQRIVGISRVRGFGIEYNSHVTNTLELYVDEIPQQIIDPGSTAIAPTFTFNLPPTNIRQWAHFSLDAVGKRLAWILRINDFTEIYSAEWFIEAMEHDSTSYDTGDMFVSPFLITPVEAIVNFFAHKPLTWHGELFVDGQEQEGVFNVTAPGPFIRRYPLRPFVGRTLRFRINATEAFSPIGITINAIGFGDGALRPVALYPKAVG